ncbi:MAG: hypothetical protein M1825_005015 [Sarcosagium campestre]|nr:MAG: hypothetical protein M1825_005015 [Sarcosagium campestre]
MSIQAPLSSTYFQFATLNGFFHQDVIETDPVTFRYEDWSFGLIDRPYPTDPSYDPHGSKSQWQRFAHYVEDLQARSDAAEQYKVLFLGRHGQGVHNVAEAFYGTKNWDCYWSLQAGDGTYNWTDPLLTPTGIKQVETARLAWTRGLAGDKMPPPQSYYVSPLSRCLETARITFSELELPSDRPYQPLVKEQLRETIGAHTCDKRSSLTFLREKFPTANFEPGFADDDPLWLPRLRETPAATAARLKLLLQDIFENDGHVWLSLTSHGGAIAGILRAIGHREFVLPTGGVIPVFVRAQRIDGVPPREPDEPWEPIVSCPEPPPPEA